MTALRVLHVYRSYYPETLGGMEEAIKQLCLGTGALGVTNTIFTLARRPVPRQVQLPEGLHVRERSWAEIASCNIGGWASVSRFRSLAAQHDVVQLHYPWPFGDLLLLGSPRKPTVVTYVSDVVRQQLLNRMYAPLRQRLLERADRIVASSPNYVATSPILSDYASKVRCIPHGLGHLPEPAAARVAHWRHQLPGDFFLFVGVLRYYKGLHTLIEAAARRQHPIVIAGDGPEGEALRALAQRLGASHVRFLGRVSDEDKLALLHLCRAIVFPSQLRSEAFGMTLLEGAQAGKPLVSCEIGTGTSWINQHLQTGLVIEPDNPATLAEALDLLAADSALCQRLGLGAQKRWASHFTREVVAQQYLQLYESLIGMPG